MNGTREVEGLDTAIDALLAGAEIAFDGAAHNGSGEDTAQLVHTAREFRYVARPDFKARLRIDLQRQAEELAASRRDSAVQLPHTTRGTLCEPPERILPTLFGCEYGRYPVHRGNFIASFALHAAALALVLSSGVWVAQHRDVIKRQAITLITDPSPYVLPSSPMEAGGGGGGGDRDKLEASRGSAPKFAREQVAPPVVVLRSPQPRLPVEATVIGPPRLTLPQTGQTGDPMGAILTASNGPGFGGGVGNGEGGGIGTGHGPGVGPGWGGGYGGGVYRVGGGVSAPRALYDPDPEYSEEARKAKYQGTVLLWVIVGPDGRAHDIKVQRSLGMGLDEKAVEAVRKWRFEPAKKDGRAVAVQVNIEVNFRLY